MRRTITTAILVAATAVAATLALRTAPSPVQDAPDHDHAAMAAMCHGTETTTEFGELCTMQIKALPHMVATPEPGVFGGWAVGADPFKPLCTGTGTDGYRVTAVYVYDASRGSDLANLAGPLRTILAEADRFIYLSGANGSARRVRWTTEPAADGCQAKIVPVAVDHSYFAQENGIAYLEALRNAGMIQQEVSAGHVAAVFVDDRHSPTFGCGAAGLYPDDSATDNPNAAPEQRFLEIKAGCWTPSTVVHELMHSLGAVQYTAPNSTGMGHCNDGVDTLCYDDGGPRGDQRLVCTGDAYRREALDCGRDDYFNVSPAPGSYLATKWNTANSPYLYTVTAPTGSNPTLQVTTVGVSGPTRTYVPVPVTLQATASSALRRLVVDGFSGCSMMSSGVLNGSTSQTVQATLVCETAVAGVDFGVADSIGRSAGARAEFTVGVPATAEHPDLSLVTTTYNGARVIEATVTAEINGVTTPLVDVPIGAANVIGWKYLTTTTGTSNQARTGSDGKVRFLAPAGITDVQVSLWPGDNSGWLSSHTQYTLTAGPIAQTITFNPVTRTTVTTPMTLTATASSGLPVTVTSATPAVCTVGDGVVSFLAAGTCTLTATQAGDSDHLAATPVTRSISVSRATQVVAFAPAGSVALATTPTLTLSAASSSGLPVTITSSTPSVCTVAGNVATFLRLGTCRLAAAQAGNSAYNPAMTVTRLIAVTLIPQTITFTAPSTMARTTPQFDVDVSASSGLPVTVTSSTSTVCTVTGTTVTTLKAGTCTLKATRAADGSFAAAPSVSRSIAVTLAAQTVTFTAPTSVGRDTPRFTVTTSASSGLPVTVTTMSPTVCTVAGRTVTTLKAGTCALRATRAADTTFSAAPAVIRMITITLVPQSITFSAPATASKTGTPQLVLTATASSGLAVTVTSSTTSVCTVAGTTVTLLKTGTCTLKAVRAGDTTYSPALAVTRSITVTA